MSKPQLSVIIETHNESGAILELAANVRKGLSGVASWEVIFADCSTNNTTGIIRGLSELDPRYRSVHFSALAALGCTSVVLQARREAQAPTILYLNARRSYSAGTIALLAAKLLEAKQREEDAAIAHNLRGWLSPFRAFFSRYIYSN